MIGLQQQLLLTVYQHSQTLTQDRDTDRFTLYMTGDLFLTVYYRLILGSCLITLFRVNIS